MAWGSNLEQKKYLELEETSIGEVLSEAEAKILINKWFGFEVSRIELIDDVDIDVTPQGQKRVQVQSIKRKPIYAATDWNYCRFNCSSYQWEMINGDILPYCD